jgi:hypothetical protein
MRTFEPAEFVSLLASNQLVEPLNLTIFGLVKTDEHDRSVLLLSISPACERWIPIPLSLISSIRYIRNVTCKDHQHPFVRLEFAEPKKEDAAAALFMRLFAQSKTKAAARAKAAGAIRPFMTQGCEVLEFDDVPYVCCPGDGGPWDCQIML